MKRLLLAAALLAAAPAFAQNIAVVNGKPIPTAKVEQFVKLLAKQGQADTPELREQIKQELITREIFLQEANRRNLLRNADVQAEIELARQGILIRALFADFEAKSPVPEADIKAEYDRVKATQSEQEFRARHILVETEQAARDIIAKLKGGAKFEDLAKQSIDTGSAANGGDLDWASPTTYVQPFADALAKLKKGELTQEPVKTQFGWHVIRLDDVRQVEFPSLEEVRPQIEQAMRQQKLRDFQNGLREKAKIQ